MISFCMFREDIRSPIFESKYDLKEGTIANIPEEKFKCVIPSYFSTDYEVPVNYSLPLSKEYYIMALQLTNGLVTFNFYDIGVTVIAKSGIYVLLIESLKIQFHDTVSIEDQNVFNYNKYLIGVYKTVVRQLDVPQNICFLLVDSDGIFLTEQGTVSINDKVKERSVEEISSMKGIVGIYRQGYDGLLLNSLDDLYKFKVIGSKFHYTKVEI